MINCFRTNPIQKQKSNSISLSCSFLSYPRDTVHTEMLSTPMTTWHWPDPYTTACPCRCNSSSLSRNSGVATETAAFPGSPKGWKTKNKQQKSHHHQMFAFLLRSLLWNIVFSKGSRKQYATPREEESKWKWRATVTSCFITLLIYNHHEQGSQHYNLAKSPKE